MKHKIEYISFDIYDTLIFRTIPQNKIYKIIGEIYKINNFIEDRLEAEKKANKKYNGVYTLENIYEFLEYENKEDIKNKEIELEINNVELNPIGKKMYEKYLNNYKIICISDMYFSKYVMKKMLNKCGYNIDNIFISSEYLKSKKNKKLYKEVIKLLNTKNILHIGDALRSDFLNSRLSGLKSKYIGKNNKDNYSRLLNDNEYLEYIGYKYFGNLLFEFCIWLKNNNSNDKLIFLSREGEFILKCYNKLFKNNYKMLYVSRKSVASSVFFKAIEKEKISDFFKLMSYHKNERIFDFIKRVGVPREYIDEKLYNLDIDIKNLKLLEENIYKNKNLILNSMQNRYINFKKYISNFDFHEMTLVDVGWNGSMQNLLNKYLDIVDCKEIIYGKYIGTFNNDFKDGFLFNKKNNISNSIMNYSGILELFLMPNYGSVLGYDDLSNPIFDNLEFDEIDLKKIFYIQKGILRYIDDIKLISKKNVFTTDEIISNLNLFGLNPNEKDIKLIGSIKFYDNGYKNNFIETKGNLKKNFIECKWKIAFLKKIFKINLPYNKILNFMRKGNN